MQSRRQCADHVRKTMTIQLNHIDHINVRCAATQLPAVRSFYANALGLVDGDRPPFAFDGAWMYLGDQAVIHIAVYSPKDAPRTGEITEGVDHFSFRTQNRSAARAHLQSQGIEFEERIVPDRNIAQIFMHDPVGTRIELTFVGEC
jgi:catechol 2,3-dioxygenase-like lactoylglutathione lyase family enzyme